MQFNKYTHTHTRTIIMIRRTGSDCAVICNLINKQTDRQIDRQTQTHTHRQTHIPGAREKGTMTFMECVRVSHEDTVEGPL